MATQPNTELRTAALSLVPTTGLAFSNQPLSAGGTDFLDNAQIHLKETTDEINNQIIAIQNAPLGVDTAGLISTINNSFNQVSSRITDAALASVRKSAIQMDAYFRSPTGDQRSGARVKMAMDMQRGLMQGAYEAIAQVYDKNTQDIINVSLESAKINASVAGIKIQGITALMGQENEAYMAVLSEVNKNYTAQLESSLRWATLQADIQHNNDVLDLEYVKVKEQASQFGAELALGYYKTDTEAQISRDQLQQNRNQFEAQLQQDRYKFDTQSDFDKYKLETTMAWEKEQFTKQFDLETKKYNDAKKAMAQKSVSDMLNLMSGQGSGQMSQTDVLKAFKAIPSQGAVGPVTDNRSDDAILKSLGWPDTERVQYSLQLKKQNYEQTKAQAYRNAQNTPVGGYGKTQAYALADFYKRFPV